MGSSPLSEPAVVEGPDSEVLDLEPTHAYAAIAPQPGESPVESRASAPMAVRYGGSDASLPGLTDGLRRRRLAASGIFLSAACLLLLVWNLAFPLGQSSWVVPASIGLRCLLAAGIAGLLLTRVEVTPPQLRLAEYLLFGGFTLLTAINQYVVNLDLLRHNDVADMVAFLKNGTFGMVVMMVIYGMFIPNHPRTTAGVVLSMSLSLVAALVLVFEHPEVQAKVEEIRTIEHAGSDILFLAVGASLAIYGSFLLNGLRDELHEARKFGQYRLIEPIGSGGMGEVYLAEHQLLKRPCALKLIKAESVANPVALARFEREVQSAARLSHPNSIEIFDYGHTEDGTFFYVMEYLPGMSLQELITKFGPLSPGRAIYILRQACAGLAEAHALGLVHRDLKPANIFIAHRGGESDVAKVLDYGLVKLTRDSGSDQLTTELTVSGTPAFMAPEQATASRDLDARADVYAIGAVAYYALTGRPPFSGETAFAIMMANARDPVTPPSQIRPEISADLEAVILKTLAKSPDDRYPDARALGKALGACEAARDWDADKADLWWAELARNEDVEDEASRS